MGFSPGTSPISCVATDSVSWLQIVPGPCRPLGSRTAELSGGGGRAPAGPLRSSCGTAEGAPAGLNRCQFCHTEPLLEPFSDARMTAVSFSDEFGITVLRPARRSLWSQWMMGKKSPDITPPNLQNRSWVDFPPTEVSFRAETRHVQTGPRCPTVPCRKRLQVLGLGRTLDPRHLEGSTNLKVDALKSWR